MFTIGIDIGKSFHVAAIMDNAGKFCVPSHKLENTKEGFQLFLQKITEVVGSDKTQTVRIAIEATGHYWMNLYSFLKEQGYQNLILLNPLQSKALRNLGIRGTKTDKVDAQSIARVVFLNAENLQHPLDENVYALRQLTRLRLELVHQMADNKRRVIRLLDLVFPEFQRIFSNVFGVTARTFLEKYPTPDDLKKLSRKRMEAIITRCARGKLDPKIITENLKSAVKNSVGICFAKDALTLHLKLLLQQIAFVENQIKETEKAMKTNREKLPAIQLLETIPGISFNLAATIFGEIGDINKFKKADSLVAYAGMDTKVIQSGNFEGTKAKLSKRGSPYLRWAYACAAGVARIHDPSLKKIFEKKRAQGKPYGIAITAVVHKMIHITYAVLKQKKLYECHLQV